MKNAFAGKVSYFILTFVFLIIIASFLFTGFDKFSLGTGGNVATVDGTPITFKEFQGALNRQVEFFNKMMGGEGMTQKQLEEMGIKQSVLNSLIQQKLILNSAEQMGIVVSLEEIKNEIKDIPEFKTAEKFDVNRYRNLLQGNGYTPSQFEGLIGDDLKQKKVDQLFNTLLVSEKYVQDVNKFKNNQVTVQGVKIGRQALAPLISISEEEINAYLNKAENQSALEAAYSENIEKYNKPEEVKARHILLSGDKPETLKEIQAIRAKVNPKNFAEIAQKRTQDPTGKNNGGDLGWFSTGRMVPEFEKVAFNMKKGEISEPVKTEFGYHIIYVEDKKAAENKPIESVKKELARSAVQKTKAQDLDQVLKSTAKEIQVALENNDFSKVESLAKKVDGQVFKNAEVNQYDQNIETTNLAPQEAEKVFSANTGAVLDFGNPGTIFLVKVLSKKTEEAAKTPEELKAEISSQNQLYSRRVREELIKTMNNKAKVVTNQGLL
jgi:peptidyl-prolyl cis-trans isomerase D